MFKRKSKTTWSAMDTILEQKIDAVFDARQRLKEIAKKVIQSQQVISILPEGPDKAAEIKHCEKLQESLLAAMGAYECRVLEHNDFIERVDKTTIHLALKPITTVSSHEILRNLF